MRHYTITHHRIIPRTLNRNKMDSIFIGNLKKKLVHDKKCVTKFAKVTQVRSLFLMLNREKYKQFSFALKDQAFWRIVSFKTVEFECEINMMICATETALLRKTQKKTQRKTQQEISNMKKKITYYNLALKTLKKYDKHYGEKIGLALNRLFCKDISHYIRDFI